MHSLMPVGFLIHLFMNDFLPGFFFSICFCNLMVFYDWRECVNFDIKNNNPRAVVLTLGNKVVFYCCSLVEHR